MARRARTRPTWRRWTSPRRGRRIRELWWRERRKADLVAAAVAKVVADDVRLAAGISRAVMERYILDELRVFNARDRREWLEREAWALMTPGF